jgi:hypothetical protein
MMGIILSFSYQTLAVRSTHEKYSLLPVTTRISPAIIRMPDNNVCFDARSFIIRILLKGWRHPDLRLSGTGYGAFAIALYIRYFSYCQMAKK